MRGWHARDLVQGDTNLWVAWPGSAPKAPHRWSPCSVAHFQLANYLCTEVPFTIITMIGSTHYSSTQHNPDP